MTAGMQSYLRRTALLKNLLKPSDRALLARLEAANDYDNPNYAKLMMEKLYPQMLCRIQPWPEPLTRSFSKLNEKIYVQMQGKSEFLVTGNLKGWERWDRLSEIKATALTIGATHDEMDPADMKRISELMPNATGFICPEGSHMCMWDDQAIYFDRLLAWLQTI